MYTVALRVDGAHLSFTTCDDVNHLARELFRDQHCKLLDGLAFLAINLFDDDFRLTYLEFVTLTTHGLYQDGEMKYAATVDEQRVGRPGLFNTHGKVLLQFVVQALTYMTAGHIFALLAKEWRVVDGEEHAHGGLVDLDGGQRLGILGVADGVANLKHHILVKV